MFSAEALSTDNGSKAILDNFAKRIVPQNARTALYSSHLIYVILKLKLNVIAHPKHMTHMIGLSTVHAMKFAFQMIVNVSRC